MPKPKYKSQLLRLPGYSQKSIRLINKLLRWPPPNKPQPKQEKDDG